MSPVEFARMAGCFLIVFCVFMFLLMQLTFSDSEKDY